MQLTSDCEVVVAFLTLTQSINDLADRIELEVRVLLPQLFDRLVGGNAVLSHRTKLLPDVIVSDRFLAEQLVLVENRVDLISDQTLQRISMLK